MDFSPAMLRKASKRYAKSLVQSIQFVHDDVSRMESIQSGTYDWIVTFFLYRVLQQKLRDQAVSKFARVLKSDGKFRIQEIRYSAEPTLRNRQKFFTLL